MFYFLNRRVYFFNKEFISDSLNKIVFINLSKFSKTDSLSSIITSTFIAFAISALDSFFSQKIIELK